MPSRCWRVAPISPPSGRRPRARAFPPFRWPCRLPPLLRSYQALDGVRGYEPVLASLRATLQGHRAAGGAAVTEPALASATAWQLLAQRAWRCAVNLKPGRYALVPSLLALAERLATAGTVDAAAATSREAA